MKGRYWPWFLGALLASSMLANGFLIAKATTDPSFAVEPDYYQKAVDWDRTQAARAGSVALGWHVSPKMTRGRLELRLTDRDGTAVTGAKVEVEAFHNARANHVLQGSLTETSGTYALDAAFDRPGLWELRVRATRGDDVFVTTLQEEVR